jgi:hypothetical protein
MSQVLSPTQPRPAEAPPAEARPAPFRLVQSATHHLSRDKALILAREHQALPHSPTERDLQAARLNELVTRIKANLLLPCNWATVLYEGVKYRMNGQHSSQALLDCADCLPERVSIHLDHYEADAAAGMGILFRQFDARISGRSRSDVAGAYQGLVKALDGVNRRKGKLGIEGVCWYRRTLDGFPVPSSDDLYQEFMTPAYHSFLRWLDKILSVKTPELERAPIIGTMYGTFVKSESGSQDFWSHVAKNDLTDDSHPSAVLSAELVQIKEGRRNGQTPSPAEFYCKCAKAWNAFRGGEKIRSLNVNPKKGLPELAP